MLISACPLKRLVVSSVFISSGRISLKQDPFWGASGLATGVIDRLSREQSMCQQPVVRRLRRLHQSPSLIPRHSERQDTRFFPLLSSVSSSIRDFALLGEHQTFFFSFLSIMLFIQNSFSCQPSTLGSVKICIFPLSSSHTHAEKKCELVFYRVKRRHNLMKYVNKASFFFL